MKAQYVKSSSIYLFDLTRPHPINYLGMAHIWLCIVFVYQVMPCFSGPTFFGPTFLGAHFFGGPLLGGLTFGLALLLVRAQFLVQAHFQFWPTSFWLELKDGLNWKWTQTRRGPRLEVGPNLKLGSKKSPQNATKYPVA